MAAASRGTARHAIRIDDDLWAEFGRVAEPDRTTVLVDYVKRYIRAKQGTVPPPRKRKPRQPATSAES